MRAHRTVLSLVLTVLFVAAFVAAPAEAQVDDATQFERWIAQKAQPYEGVTIQGISESTPPSTKLNQEIIPRFEKLTGINVNFNPTSWGAMYNKSIQDMVRGSGIYDFIYVEQDIVYSYIQKDWLTNMTRYRKNHPQITHQKLDVEDFTTFANNFRDSQGDLYGMPFESFLKVYTYRADLFNDSEIQQAYEDEYGEELEPAESWEEYEQIAQFFYEWGQMNDEDIYGHAAQAKDHPSLGYAMVETYWPAVGILNWGIDLNTMRAKNGTLNSRTSIKQFERFIRLLDYAPPAVKTYTWDGVAGAMASGKVAQAMIYGENVGWIGTDASQSEVTGDVGVALPPSPAPVRQMAKSEDGYLGYYDGAALAIPHSSKKKEAAWLFLQYMSAAERSQNILAEQATAVTRDSVLNQMVGSDLDRKLGGYFTLMKDKGHMFKGAPPFPFHKILMESVYLPNIVSAVHGNKSPKQAVRKLEKDVDNLLLKLGY